MVGLSVCVCLCVCLLVTFVSPATAEPIEMSFGRLTPVGVGIRNHVLDEIEGSRSDESIRSR